MSIVVFDPAAFAIAYPEFATVAQARTTMLFDMAAATLLDNTDNSPVMDIGLRTQLFYLLVAHLLLLLGSAPTAPDNTPPGRLSSATEGTITTSFEYLLPPGSAMAPWFVQTKYGAMFWTMTAQFRSARIIANGDSGIGRAIAYGSIPYYIPGGV
jgi:hypothetical protein